MGLTINIAVSGGCLMLLQMGKPVAGQILVGIRLRQSFWNDQYHHADQCL